MAEQMRPASKEQAPDPSDNYERAHPEHESGMGRLDNNVATPTDQPDQIQDPVKNKQPLRQINAENETDPRAAANAPPGHGAQTTQGGRQPDHSMMDEEPLGEDQAPTDIHDPRHQRHPRVGGKGGTPDAGESPRRG